MTDLRQAATLALDAWDDPMGMKDLCVAMDAIRTALEQQAEPPPEWPLIKNILAVFGLDAIAFVAKWKAAQQQAEPDELTVVYMSGVRDGKRQRQWVPLTEAEHTEIAVASGCLDADWVFYGAAVERALKERNAPDEAQQAMRDLLKTGTGVLLGGG